MPRAPWHDDWSRVDATADPMSFVRYLDASRAAWRPDAAPLAALALRTGMRVLDVGCGTGDVARAIVAAVGPAGRVVGVDASETMVREARRRGGEVEFLEMDAQALRFDDGAFDLVRCSALLEHLRDPARALREMARVAAPGGRVWVHEPDWGAASYAADDAALAAKVVAFVAGALPHGRIGRDLDRLLGEAGLREVESASEVLHAQAPLEGHAQALDTMLERALAAGALTADEARRWRADQLARATRGAYAFWLPTVRAWGVR